MANLDLGFEKQQIGDIFEVSINSKKLLSILKQFQDNHKKLEKKVDRIDDFYKQGDSALNRKIFNIQNTTKHHLKQELEQIKLTMLLQMRKYEEKYIKQLHQKQSKINEIKYSIQTLNDKINKVNSNLTQEIQNSVRNYSTETFSLRRNFEKSEDMFQGALEQIAQKLQNCKVQLQNHKENIFDLEVKLKKYTDIAMRPFDANYIPCPDKKFEDCINGQKYSNQLQIQNIQKSKIQYGSHSKQRQRYRKQATKKSFLNTSGSMKKSRLFSKTNGQQQKPNKQNYMTTLQYASISAKVESLQKQFQLTTEKSPDSRVSQPRSSVFKRSGKTTMMKTISYSKEMFQKSMISNNVISQVSFEDMQDFQILQAIMGKLQQISASIEKKQTNLKKMIQQIKQKQIAAEQKSISLKQKQSKINSEISEIKIKLLTLEKKNSKQTQSQSISNIESQLGKLIQRFDKESQLKLSIDAYNDEKQKMNEKVNVIQENLIYKAEKDDVKKAINFLEDKIKEIILIMANQFNQDKIGAINKIPTKCLTCDRELLKFDNLTNMASTKGFKGASSGTARQLGQKYYTRLIKSKKEVKNINKEQRQHYTSATQVTQQKQDLGSFT